MDHVAPAINNPNNAIHMYEVTNLNGHISTATAETRAILSVVRFIKLTGQCIFIKPANKYVFHIQSNGLILPYLEIWHRRSAHAASWYKVFFLRTATKMDDSYIPTLLTLHTDLLPHCILNRLETADLLVCSMTCRTMRRLIAKNWKLYSPRWNLSDARILFVPKAVLDNNRQLVEWWILHCCDNPCPCWLQNVLERGWVDLASHIRDSNVSPSSLRKKKLICNCGRSTGQAAQEEDLMWYAMSGAIMSDMPAAIEFCLSNGGEWNSELAVSHLNQLSVKTYQWIIDRGLRLPVDYLYERAFIFDRQDIVEWIHTKGLLNKTSVDHLEYAVSFGAPKCLEWLDNHLDVFNDPNVSFANLNKWIKEAYHTRRLKTLLPWLRNRLSGNEFSVDWNAIIVYLIREADGSLRKLEKYVTDYLPNNTTRWDVTAYSEAIDNYRATGLAVYNEDDDATDDGNEILAYLMRTSDGSNFRNALDELCNIPPTTKTEQIKRRAQLERHYKSVKQWNR